MLKRVREKGALWDGRGDGRDRLNRGMLEQRCGIVRAEKDRYGTEKTVLEDLLSRPVEIMWCSGMRTIGFMHKALSSRGV